jgi:hypothetical protein
MAISRTHIVCAVLEPRWNALQSGPVYRIAGIVYAAWGIELILSVVSIITLVPRIRKGVIVQTAGHVDIVRSHVSKGTGFIHYLASGTKDLTRDPHLDPIWR